MGLVEWIHSGKRCRQCLELRPDAQVSEGQQRALFSDDGAKLHGTARCSSIVSRQLHGAIRFAHVAKNSVACAALRYRPQAVVTHLRINGSVDGVLRHTGVL